MIVTMILLTSDPAAGGVEVSAAGYARQVVDLCDDPTDPRWRSNAERITFGPFGEPATVTWFVMLAVSGEVIGSAPLGRRCDILPGGTIEFRPGTISVAAVATPSLE